MASTLFLQLKQVACQNSGYEDGGAMDSGSQVAAMATDLQNQTGPNNSSHVISTRLISAEKININSKGNWQDEEEEHTSNDYNQQGVNVPQADRGRKNNFEKMI